MYQHSSHADVVDLAKWPEAEQLVARCCDFLDVVQNLTPGKDLEARLNRDFGPGSEHYEALCRQVRRGLEQGWLAATEIAGPAYRRGKVALPSERTRYMSITAVYMESAADGGEGGTLRGQYHAHPYGEINCVVPVSGAAPELRGMQGWQGAGWTSPGPGTHHYPEARGGALVALFFLPAGRISYDSAAPGMPQPASV
ncbi:hypothetical protein HIM_03499 [Hirsutella minnesotensis 3608]|uniref:p-hydroxylaminobenzoate lyase n=1 Tax=Hirsutella minnesotensis 3608 TaxID=1043627 RepID=A0A0F7ZVT6_9HYPO|nr:hypothetical protein HIM_03499 [Hirsutella minnesotensis 3608]